MPAIVVQKFGGTSVATPDRVRAVAARVCGAQRRGDRPVVVISAMGNTTDTLLALAHDVAGSAARRPSREMDLLLASGEQVSAALLALALEELGVPALALTGAQAGIVTDHTHRAARVRRVRARRVHDALREGRTPVVAGFQGISPGRDVTTLGRGGSDTTAVALAVALEAIRCDIFTDVHGIYSADPGKVAGARRHDRLSHRDALLLALAGAAVLHPRAAALAAAHRLPLHVLSGLAAGETTGTTIEGESPVEGPRFLGVAAKVAAARVTLDGRADAGTAARVLGALAAADIPVDSLEEISVDGVRRRLSAVVPTEFAEAAERAMAAAAPAGSTVRIHRASVRITVVGTGLSACGADIALALHELTSAEIDFHGLGITETGITLDVTPRVADEAVRILHGTLVEEPVAQRRRPA